MIEFSNDVEQLCTRITEDMEECVFYCENDPGVVNRFFKRGIDPEDQIGGIVWLFKSPDELFDREIVNRFQVAANDISEACNCYFQERYTASVFHSMRIVEIGLLSIAGLVGLSDPKPSWGSILARLDKYAFHAKYEELPERVKPYRNFLINILPRMHAVQHAWRNKADHATLIPLQPFEPYEAKEVLDTTESLMRILAKELPGPVTA